MKNVFFYTLVSGFLFICGAGTAEAATISCADEACERLWISGEIVSGDALKFAQIVEKNASSLKGVMLSSEGGLPQEAMKIGRIVRDKGLYTEAPATVARNGVLGGGRALCKGAECVCASACFLIWTAGVERHGDRIGIHRPVADFGGHKPGLAAELYYEAALMPRLLALLADLRGYLGDMNVPLRYINRMTRVRHNDTYWLSAEEAVAMVLPST